MSGVACSPLTKPDHGQYFYDTSGDKLPGTKANLKCDQGYTPQGRNSSYCDLEGEWAHEDLNCSKIVNSIAESLMIHQQEPDLSIILATTLSAGIVVVFIVVLIIIALKRKRNRRQHGTGRHDNVIYQPTTTSLSQPPIGRQPHADTDNKTSLTVTDQYTQLTQRQLSDPNVYQDLSMDDGNENVYEAYESGYEVPTKQQNV